MAETTQRTAPVDANGVLANVIQQVSDGSPAYSETRQTYSCKFKGPYEVFKDANRMVDKWLDEALNTLHMTVSKLFDFPDPPDNTDWWVIGTSVEQLEAGDHAILTVTCEARINSVDPGDKIYNDPYSDTWQLRWESYTLKPFAFCSNADHYDVSTTSPVVAGQPMPGPAKREHIEMFMNNNDRGVNEGFRWYRDDMGQGWYLNDAENLILDKELEGKNALWHYPVLTHTTVQDHFVSNVSSVLSNNITYTQVIGNQIDHIVAGGTPDGCPYTFPDDPEWQWVKTGDDMTHVKTKKEVRFQRTETFMGVISADLNYYGNTPFDLNNLKNCRWIPGRI